MFINVFRSAALAVLVAGSITAADDPFVGKWKYNQDKSKVTGQRVKIDELAPNKYKFDSGAVPQVLVADGTDQPMEFGGTASLTKTGDNSWKMVSKKDGRVLSESTWTLSPEGKTLTVHTTGTRLDGTTFEDEGVVGRVTGKSGLAGTWESKAEKEKSKPVDWEIQPYEGGISFVYPSDKGRLDVKFDGKDYAEVGPNAPVGILVSGKRLKPDTIQLTDKHQGKVMDTVEYKVSADGKTLTATVHNTGQQKPVVFVYDRQ
jgi:hypothetical protein